MICPATIYPKQIHRNHKTSSRGLVNEADAKRGNTHWKVPKFLNQEYLVPHGTSLSSLNLPPCFWSAKQFEVRLTNVPTSATRNPQKWEISLPVYLTFSNITFGRTARVLSILTRPLHGQRAVGTEGVHQAGCNKAREGGFKPPSSTEQTAFSVCRRVKVKHNESLKHHLHYAAISVLPCICHLITSKKGLACCSDCDQRRGDKVFPEEILKIRTQKYRLLCRFRWSRKGCVNIQSPASKTNSHGRGKRSPLPSVMSQGTPPRKTLQE